MAHPKSRLGRGLSGLISGGISAPAKTEVKATAKGAKPEPKAEVKASPAKPAAKPVPEPAKAPAASAPVAAPVEAQAVATPTGLLEIPLLKIEPNPYQPRKEFAPEQLRELADSIRAEGLLQPVVVRRVGDSYQLIAGERRWRACQLIGLKRIPARLIEATDASSAVLSLIENLQRTDLNAIEEAMGYASLIRDFGLTQEALAERVGKSRPVIANALRLLQLDREIQGYLAKGTLSVGHAKVLLGVENAEQRVLLARQVIQRSLSVRDTERLVAVAQKQTATPGGAPRVAPEAEQTAIKDLERKLTGRLATRVSLQHSPKRGKIVIEYYGNDDLQRILDRIGLSG